MSNTDAAFWQDPKTLTDSSATPKETVVKADTADATPAPPQRRLNRFERRFLHKKGRLPTAKEMR